MTLPLHVCLVTDNFASWGFPPKYFEQHGVRATLATGRERLAHIVSAARPDVLVIDADLPSEGGLMLCRELRSKNSTVPLVLVGPTTEMECILGFELGADEVLGKPVSPRLLLARVRALWRRHLLASTMRSRSPPVEVGRGVFDVEAHTVTVNGETHTLRGVEWGVLRALVDHPDTVMTRQQLLTLSGGDTGNRSMRAIDVTVARLRALLGLDSMGRSVIKTVRRHGYVFTPRPTPGLLAQRSLASLNTASTHGNELAAY